MWVRVAVAGAGCCSPYVDFPDIDKRRPSGDFASGDVPCAAVLINKNVIAFRLGSPFKFSLKTEWLSRTD